MSAVVALIPRVLHEEAMNRFETIWEQYEKELSAYVLSRVRDKEIQKEVMQEVALKIFVSLHQQKAHLRGWLYRICKNAINDYFRRENREDFEMKMDDEPAGHILDECLVYMLEQLYIEDKEILEETQLQGYTLKEVAEQRSLSLSAIKSKVFRAKKSLANLFFSCCEYERNSRGEIVEFEACNDMCLKKGD